MQVCQHCGTVWVSLAQVQSGSRGRVRYQTGSGAIRLNVELQGRDANSATNVRHALMDILLGREWPVALRRVGGDGGGGGGPGPTSSSGSGPGPGGSSPGPSSCGVHVRSGGGEQGHMEEDSAASPKKRRRRAG